MAVSYISSSSNKSTTATVVITAPAGIANDDILICFASAYRATNATAGDITAPAGWNTVGLQITSTRYKSGMFWKRAASESGTYTFSSATAVQMQGAISVYRGCTVSGSPIDVFSNTAFVTASTAIRAATITPTDVDGFFVYGGWYYLAGTIGITAPAGMNSLQSQLNTNNALVLADLAYTTVAASGNKDATAGASATVKHAIMVALKRIPVSKPVSINVGGTWKVMVDGQINVAGVWKTIAGIQENIGGVWKVVY